MIPCQPEIVSGTFQVAADFFGVVMLKRLAVVFDAGERFRGNVFKVVVGVERFAALVVGIVH